MVNDMWHVHDEILGTYILQEKLSDTSCFEQWVALAMYSPHRFLLRFLKKEISSFCVEALKNEILSLYHYSVDGVIPIVEVEAVETQLVISSEYRDELLLKDLTPLEFPRDEEFLFALALRLARTLYFFHTHGVCWGALLPEGLWVRKKVPRPEDFFFLPPGYAAVLPFVLGQNQLEQGDIPLIAPEVRDDKAVSVQGDIYSLGALMQFLGTGSSLQPELFAIFSRCNEPNPSQRYRSVEEVIRDLESWGEKLGILQEYGSFDSYQKERDGGDKKGMVGTTLLQEGGYSHPQSEPRPEVLNYFQALSETYRSRYGYEGEGKNALPAAPIQNGALKVLPPSAPQNVALSHQEKGGPPKEETPSGQKGPGIADTRAMQKGGVSGGTLLPSTENPYSREGTTDGVVSSAGKQNSFVEQGENPFDYSSPEGDSPAFRWERNRVLLQDVEKVLEGVVRRVRSGRGDLRFIVTSNVFSLKKNLEEAEFWSQLRQWARLVVIEPVSLSVNPLTVNDFISSLIKGIEKSLAQESVRQRQRLEKNLREACKNYRQTKNKEERGSSFSIVPAKGETSLQQDPEIFQDPRGAISCLIALSSPRRPLFLIWWCPTEMDSSLISYLRNLIPFVLEQHICFWVWTETIPSGIL